MYKFGKLFIFCFVCRSMEKDFISKISEIKERVRLLFEKEEEKEYAEKIIVYFLRPKIDYAFCEENVIGYKSRVIRKLRELDVIIKTIQNCFWINLREKEDEQYSEFIYFKDGPQVFIRRTKELLEKAIKKDGQMKQNSYINRYVCSECEYKWESKKKFGEPAKCPKCRSKKMISFNNLKKMF